jgi:hypothetical protein
MENVSAYRYFLRQSRCFLLWKPLPILAGHQECLHHLRLAIVAVEAIQFP